ncbi:MAG: hypothetical protein LLG00_08905 [Planctomycetaceae bacterium]|nr:hypothetical protein [Planctomycetaceae bacterium]
MRISDIRQERRAVTICELLAVMTVMAVMSGVLWRVGVKAVVLANNARVVWELHNLSDAVEQFCQQFGDYPPDFHDPVAVRQFIAAKFPKCPPKCYPNITGQSPATALYFWLAGPDGRGFSTNPSNPFGNGRNRIGPFIKFDPKRLRTVGGGVQYIPPGGTGTPYVYFRGGMQGYDGNTGWSPVHPYRSSANNEWINHDTFQIISPGDDGHFGGGHHFPAGADYDEANYDDVANFSAGTMAQAMARESETTVDSAQPKDITKTDKARRRKNASKS